MISNAASAKPSVWDVNCHGAKTCSSFEAVEFGRTLFVIADGDGPAGVGGPCDLGKLVRAVKAHYESQHPPLPSNVACFDKISQAWGACPGDPTPLPLSEDFQSWEVCGDEGDGGFGTFTYPPPLLPKDPKTLRDMADCIERRAEKRKRAAKWQEEQEEKRERIEADLKAQLSRCEPKPKG